MDYQESKKCGKCKEVLPLGHFKRRQSYCKSCLTEYHKDDSRREYSKRYRETLENQERHSLLTKREKIKRKWRSRRKKLEEIIYYESITEKICNTCGEMKPLSKYWKDMSRVGLDGRRQVCGSCCYKSNRPKSKVKRDYRWSNDNLFKTSTLIRNHTTRYLDGQKNKSTEEILGISTEGFTEYLEDKFLEGMTWENQGEWVLDHIVPVSLGETEEELYKLNHYTNFQPLWKTENLKKSNHLFPEHYPLYETLLGKKFEKKLQKG